MHKEKLFDEILYILDLSLGLADADKPRIRSVMTSLFDGKVTQDAIDLLRDMSQQQNEYASEGVENIGCLELAHRLESFAERLEKILNQ